MIIIYAGAARLSSASPRKDAGARAVQLVGKHVLDAFKGKTRDYSELDELFQELRATRPDAKISVGRVVAGIVPAALASMAVESVAPNRNKEAKMGRRRWVPR